MKNTKSTKRALLSAILALVMTVSMLVGTTFAWFTDSVTSANNVIKSGNLDIELEYWNGTKWEDVQGKSDILTNTLWEPGVTEVAYLRVANAGSLALKYQLGVNIVSEKAGVNAAGVEFKLSDYIQFGVVENVNGQTGAYANREAAVAAVTGAKKISAGYTKADSMTPDAELYLALVVWMPAEVGNVANHNGEDVPEINLGIDVVATQLASEDDSFGKDYDEDAKLPELSFATKKEDEPAAVGSSESRNGVKIDIPADAPAGGYNVEVTNVNESTDADGNTTVSMNIDLKKDGAKVETAAGVVYTVSFNVGAGKIITAVEHNGQPVVDYSYDQDTGILTFATDSFSPFAFTYCDDPTYGKVAQVGEVYYETLAAALDVAVDGDTITLIDNLTSPTYSYEGGLNIKKAITLDLGGNTITDGSIKVEKDVTVQNGKLVNTTQSNPLVAKYGAKLTVNNVKIEDSKSQHAIWIDDNSSLVFNSGSITSTRGENNIHSNIYAIRGCKNTSITINDGIITVDTPNAKAYGIYCSYDNANVTVNGGKISTSGTGYNYAINTYGNITVNGGEIVTNENRYGYSSGIAYGNNYALYAKGDITITGGKITTNGYNGYLVNLDGSNQTVTISNGEFANVLTEIDKTVGGHKAPALVYGSSANVSITGGTFAGFDAALAKSKYGSTPLTISVKGGTFDVAVNSACVAGGYELVDNGDGTWTVQSKLIQIHSSEELVAAVQNKKDGDILFLNAGDYSIRFTNNTSFNADGLTIIGADGVNLSVSSSEVWYGRIQAENVTFENIHFVSNVGSTGTATYNNCEFDAWVIAASSGNKKTAYNNCTINGVLNTSIDFSAGDITVKNSYVDEAEYSGTCTITFDGCELGKVTSWNMTTVIKNSTVENLVTENMKDKTITVDGVVVAP